MNRSCTLELVDYEAWYARGVAVFHPIMYSRKFIFSGGEKLYKLLEREYELIGISENKFSGLALKLRRETLSASAATGI